MKPLQRIRRGAAPSSHSGATFAIMLLSVLSGCDVKGDGSRSAPLPVVEPDTPLYGLRGTWLAVDLIVTSATDPETKINLVPQGAVLSLRIHDDLSYVFLHSLTGGPAYREEGTMVVGDSTLTLTAIHINRTDRVFKYAFNFERLILDFMEEFDLDGDGVDEPAAFHAELVDLEFGLDDTKPNTLRPLEALLEQRDRVALGPPRLTRCRIQVYCTGFTLPRRML